MCALIMGPALHFLTTELNGKKRKLDTITINDFMLHIANNPTAKMCVDLATSFYLGISLYDTGIKVKNLTYIEAGLHLTNPMFHVCRRDAN